MENRLMINRQNKLILVVEDSPVQALALTRLLERNKLDVLCASNGESGILMARCYLPDLIVLDVQMPGINGLEACERLRQNQLTAHIPIILFTACSEMEIMNAGLAQGAVDFIPKDAFSDLVLIETLRQLHFIDALSSSKDKADQKSLSGSV